MPDPSAGLPHRNDALDDLMKLKELIDGNSFAPMLTQMQQRAWLMHWGLFIFFNIDNGRNLIIEFLMQDRCVSVVDWSVGAGHAHHHALSNSFASVTLCIARPQIMD